jgi:hypothetical protein
MLMSELTALRARCLRGAQRGHLIARAEHYAAALGGGNAPRGVAKHSAGHLLALCDAALAGKPLPKAKAAKKAAPPPPASEPEMEMDSEDSADEDEEVPPYAEWTKKELYAEADDRDIDGRSSMSKAELVAALEADDDSPEADD